MNNKNYIDYEQQVINLLESQIKKEDKEANTASNYTRFFEEYNGKLTIDFAVLDKDQKDKVLQAYYICTPVVAKRNSERVRAELGFLQRKTGAQQVFLAYLDKNNDLKVFSLTEFESYRFNDITFLETVDSFSSFYKIINLWCGVDLWDDSKFFFRGHSWNFKPIPGVYREKKEGEQKHKIIEDENNLYYEAIRRKPLEFTPDMTAFDNLVKMQHYGLPTRLLDVSANPLVALFFACNKDFNKDGKVLVYSITQDQQKYFDSDVVCLLANLAKRPISFDYGIKKQKKYLFRDTHKDRPTFNIDDNWDKAINEVYCVLPKLNNDRIVKQDGAFFIYGIKGNTKDNAAEMLDQPSEIIIKAAAKQSILKELNLLGINEASLFPETDKVMQQIKNKFL